MSSIDSAINNDFLRISKSIVPYLDADKQRAAAIFIKAFELMSTIDLFSKEEFVRSITKPRESGWEKSFLNDIKSNFSDDRAFFIDAILKLSEVRDLLAVKNSSNTHSASPLQSFQNIDSVPQQTTPSPPTNNASQVIDKLSSVLDPNQVQLLKMLSAFMK